YQTSFVVFSHLSHRALHSFPTRRSSDLYSCFAAPSSGPLCMLMAADGLFTTGARLWMRTWMLAQWSAFSGVQLAVAGKSVAHRPDRKSTRLNSSHVATSYAVFCLKKKNT